MMSEPITIIGSETIVNGNLEGDEDLTVEGRVEGSISLSKTLSVEVGGVVRADINVRNAVISGVLVGNIEAQEAVNLTDQGRVIGDISAPRVILVDGSSFKGNIDMGDFDIEQAEVDVNSVRKNKPSHVERVRDVEEIEQREPAQPGRKASERKSVSRASESSAKRPLPQKKKTQKKAPAPQARSVGKKTKSRKKKSR